MADDRIEISISADTRGFTKGLDSATTRLTTLNTKITSTSRNLNTLQTRLSGMGSAIQAATGGFSNFTKNFAAINAGMSQLAASHQTLAQSAANLGNRLDSVRPSFQRHGSGAREAASGVSHFNDTIKNLSFALIALRTVSLVGEGIFKGIVGEAIKANAELERTKVLLTGLSNGTTDGSRALQVTNDLNYIYDMAKKIPVSIDAMSESFVRFKAVGLDPRTVQGLYDATGHFGGTSQNIQHSRLALAEMMEGGKVQMRQLRMLSMTGGIASANQDMAEAAGFKGVNQLFAAMKKGAVNAQDVVPKLLDIWEKRWAGSAEKMATTWTGMLQLLKNNWQAFLAETMEADTKNNGANSLFNTIKQQASDFIAWLQSNQGKNFAAEMWQNMAQIVNEVVKVVKSLWDYRDVISAAAGATRDMLEAVNSILGYLSPFKDQLKGIVEILIKFYEFKLLKSIFLDFGGAIGSVGKLAAPLLSVGSNLAKVTTSFGALGGAIAEGEGIAVAAGGAFAGLGLAFSEIIIPLGLLAAGAYILYKAVGGGSKTIEDNTVRTYDNAHAQQVLGDTQKLVDEATKNTTFTTEKARDAALEHASAIWKLIDAKKADLNLDANILKYKAAYQDASNDYNKTITERDGYKAATTNSLGWKNPNILAYGWNKLVDNYYGSDTDKKGATLNQARKDYVDGLNARTMYNKQLAAIGNYTNNVKNITPLEHPTLGDMPGKPNTKLDNAMDSARNRWADLMLTQAEDKFKLANNGSTEGFDAQSTREGLFEQSKSVIDKYFSADNIRTAKDQIRNLFAGISQENQKLEKELRVQNIFSTLSESVNKAKEDAEASFSAIFTGFKTMSSIEAARKAEAVKQNKAGRNQVAALGDPNKLAAFDSQVQEEADARTLDDANKRAEQLISADMDVQKALRTTGEQEAAEMDRKKKEIDDLISYYQTINQNGKFDKTINGLNQYKGDLQREQQIKNNPIAGWAMKQADLQKNITDTLGNGLTGWFDQLAEGKQNFSQFAQSLVSDLGKVIAKAIIAKALMSALGLSQAGGNGFGTNDGTVGGAIRTTGGGLIGAIGKGIAGLFGIGGGSNPVSGISLDNTGITSKIDMSGLGGMTNLPDFSQFPMVSDDPSLGNWGESSTIGAFHSGGTIGSTAPLHKSVPSGIFNFAKRFHSGGFPGLKDGEVPIIAKKGEGVFTPEQMSALGDAGTASSQGGAPVVNVTNQTSAPVDTNNVKTEWNGERYVTDIVLKAGQKPGPMRDLLRSR